METDEEATFNFPWTFEQETSQHIIIRAQNRSAHRLGEQICSLKGDKMPMMRERARLIVRACNNYGKLLHALKEFIALETTQEDRPVVSEYGIRQAKYLLDSLEAADVNNT